MLISFCRSVNSLISLGIFTHGKGQKKSYMIFWNLPRNCIIPLLWKRWNLFLSARSIYKCTQVKRSQEIYRFEKVSPLSATISTSGRCAPESHSRRVLPALARSPQAWGTPRGWAVLLAWVTGRQRHSSLGYRLQRPWSLSEPHRGVLP
uniref:Uncharacterized protein n=1 Tax=Pipistrellus kuhlii TaxID=59472 RepID=A0A7J7X043_PIPKU|nr:hypothetical protein mPipKuh1_010772 [Pipistrellus kuhlii]